MQNIINALKNIKFNILTHAEGNGRFDIARIQENEIISKLNENERENVKSRIIIYNNQNVFSLQ